VKILELLLAGALCSTAMYANHPSFDCNKVKKASPEHIICQDESLMNLDKDMAALYKQAKVYASKDDNLKGSQRTWIKTRNACAKNSDAKACMTDLYKSRMEQLQNQFNLSMAKEDDQSSSSGFDKTMKLQGVSFHVKATNDSSLNKLTLTPLGFKESNEVVNKEIDGSVVSAEVADLNNDGFPEVYIYISSAGSGSYGSLLAYASNHNKSMTPIFLPPLEDDKTLSQGYMGHDTFTVVENILLREFPIYKKDDSNAKPSGGTRQIAYELVAGEAGWMLKVKKSKDY
jgi:uncharacterized protein